MRKDSDFTDVTLISEDKVKFSAHKLLLSSCSNMFKFILKDNIHTNPLLYLGGVSSQNMGFILDYIYYGEVNIYQEHLDSFLESAQKLEISGLIGDSQDRNETEVPLVSEAHVPQIKRPFKGDEEPIFGDTCSGMVSTNDTYAVRQKRQYSKAPTSGAPRIAVGNMTPEEIEAQTKAVKKTNLDISKCFIYEAVM